METTDPATLHDTSRRRRLVRARVTAAPEPNQPPVTPLARRRMPVVYSPEPVGLGRLVIDEAAQNATTPANAPTHTELDISWMTEQQERLDFPPAHPSTNQYLSIPFFPLFFQSIILYAFRMQSTALVS